MMEALGTPGFMTFMAIIYGALGLYAIHRMRSRPSPPKYEAGQVAVSPSSTPVAVAAQAEASDGR
jgi:hypothetical protein